MLARIGAVLWSISQCIVDQVMATDKSRQRQSARHITPMQRYVSAAPVKSVNISFMILSHYIVLSYDEYSDIVMKAIVE